MKVNINKINTNIKSSHINADSLPIVNSSKNINKVTINKKDNKKIISDIYNICNVVYRLYSIYKYMTNGNQIPYNQNNRFLYSQNCIYEDMILLEMEGKNSNLNKKGYYEGMPGVRSIKDTANKGGIQYRIYYNHYCPFKELFPHIQNSKFIYHKDEFLHSISSKELFYTLLNNGYKLGYNKIIINIKEKDKIYAL